MNPINEVCRYYIYTNDVADIAWSSDSQTLLIASSLSGIMIKLDVTTCLGT